MEKKISTPVDMLCKDCPQEFNVYISYCRNLKFEEKPDYNYCRKLFTNLMNRLKYQNDFAYDWTQEKKKETQTLTKQEVSYL